jgi:hypothetical protein
LKAFGLGEGLSFQASPAWQSIRMQQALNLAIQRCLAFEGASWENTQPFLNIWGDNGYIGNAVIAALYAYAFFAGSCTDFDGKRV